MKECEKFNPYIYSMHGPLCRVHVQEAINNTILFQRCSASSVHGHISEDASCRDIVRKEFEI